MDAILQAIYSIGIWLVFVSLPPTAIVLTVVGSLLLLRAAAVVSAIAPEE